MKLIFAPKDLVRNGISFAICNSIFALGSSIIITERHHRHKTLPTNTGSITMESTGKIS